ncbi:MAG: DUF2263 domain-containing protein [Legionella sp.]|nr:DUF2263 domain-containing protein [Legionella sp.]
MFFKNLFTHAEKINQSIIKDVYTAHKPGLISGSIMGTRWRYNSLGKTLDYITNSGKLNTLKKQAQFNLKQWERQKEFAPQVVEVVNKDWGIAALETTRKHGKPYSILNMANPVFPGGAVLEGGSAQEENMWHRSTCALSLLDKNVYLDKASQTFRYNETTTKMLEAITKMSDAEQEKIKQHLPEKNHIAYKVYFSPELKVCFRGPEVILNMGRLEDGTRLKNEPDIEFSYYFLRPEEIFPFYELRSAAPELHSNPREWSNDALERYKADLQRRIASQLDTLILEGQVDVILGAWGCGEFRNDPKIVAQIYGEEIEKRASLFNHIVFAIINSGSSANYTIFEQELTGRKLGEPSSRSNSFSKTI